MTKLLLNTLYMEDVAYVAKIPYDWGMLDNCNFIISGATGMIGSFIIDVIMYRNIKLGSNCSIYAIGRNVEKAKERFSEYWQNDKFHFLNMDINNNICRMNIKADYILHAASNTHPLAYSTDPIGTITTNVIGTYNLLKFAYEHNNKKFLFASSVEIYGENRGDTIKFDELYCGYLNSNTLRAGYPESKRTGEALCQAFITEKKLNIVIPRLSRTYGPSMLMSDTKAVSQFIKDGLSKRDIILKSNGNQLYSYNYVADAVSGILATLFYGSSGEAYNIADENSDISLRELANIVAEYVNTKVVFDLPTEIERRGYSSATKAILNSYKLHSLGWEANYNIKKGIIRTIDILRD